MKKMILAIVAVAFVLSFSFAQAAKVAVAPKALAALAAPAVPATTAAPVTPEKSFAGKVDAVIVSDEAKGVQAQLALTGDTGEKIVIMIPSGTPITAVDGKTIMLGDVKIGNKAVVEYTMTAVGGNKALSIKLQ